MSAQTPRTDAAMITGEEWTAIQSRVNHDCPMNIVADLGNQSISWGEAADRIIAYTESAYIQGRTAAQAQIAALEQAESDARELWTQLHYESGRCFVGQSAYDAVEKHRAKYGRRP